MLRPWRCRASSVQRLKDLAVEEVRPALRVLLAAVAVVLLIVCANVSNLLLARGSARQREIAVRCAVGASRGRIVRQILTECLVLAAIAGVVGLLLAASGVTLVKMLAPVEAPGIFRFALGASILPRINEIGIDLKLFALASGAAAMTSLAFGVLPAFYLSRPNEFNRMGPRTGGSRGGPARTRAVLVVGQLVMATVLLVAAGLLIRSFEKLSTVNKGYDPSNVVAFQLVFPSDYPIARQVETIEALLARLRATPNIRGGRLHPGRDDDPRTDYRRHVCAPGTNARRDAVPACLALASPGESRLSLSHARANT